MEKVYDFFDRWQIEASNVTPRKFSLYVALAMDRLVEYMALCCHFGVPCIQKLDYQSHDCDINKIPENIHFSKEDFELTDYDKLVKNGLAKLDAYTERTTFNMKAIAMRLKPVRFLSLFCGIQSSADEVWRTIYFADNILERLRVSFVEDGRAKMNDDGTIDPVKGTEFESIMPTILDKNSELTRQLHAFWKLCNIVNYRDADLYEEEVTRDWYAPDDERIADFVLTEAEFVLASAMYNLGLWTPNHIED